MTVNLEGEFIRLRYLGIGEQPSEAQPLIEALKARLSYPLTVIRNITIGAAGRA